ncbi:hypothetical protein FB451DRAFT_12690 [Mycena latifolia]|nr:hypothetical protein FB451DRAFT_12690 [Mycena latifolia]
MPELPPELEREIFELALRTNRQDAAFKLTLSLVARRVQFWVDLAFYEMVTISHETQATKFVKLIASKLKPPDFFTAVKILCLPYSVTGEQACAILSACTKVQMLACWVDCTDSPELPLLVSRLPLRRLSIEYQHFLEIPVVASTWLSNLTHVDLVLWDFGLSDIDLSTLSRLPRVTHVALPLYRTASAHAAIVCSSCPNLRVLVIISDPNREEDTDPAQNYLFDPRIVVEAGPTNIIQDWEALYFGLPDLWSYAEDAIAQR